VFSLDWAGRLVVVNARSLYRWESGAASGLRPLPAGVLLRPVSDDDDAALGGLMERAYAGTIDDDLGDNNDGAVEIAGWRVHGAAAAASFVAVDAAGPVAASLVTVSDGSAWIGYVITDPGWKGRGLGTAVVAASLGVLVGMPGVGVFAGVTDGNTPSERLLASLGFVRIGPA
jgi:GNAT superfamily N-acetyltransferase